jgi:hypothetical protein
LNTRRVNKKIPSEFFIQISTTGNKKSVYKPQTKRKKFMPFLFSSAGLTAPAVALCEGGYCLLSAVILSMV